MSDEKPVAVARSSYRPPDYLIETVDLSFDLRDGATRVDACLEVVRNSETQDLPTGPPPLVLNGEGLELQSIAIDGRILDASEYRIEGDTLTLESVPSRFELTTEVVIHPESNTALSGLYQTSGNYCTQCEAMGFRRITYFLDRPDVMSRYSVTIEADLERYPVLLSNGNRVSADAVGDGRHRVRWEDPFPKPSYLFALVAGDLRCHGGHFETMSGRNVRLEIWVEPQNIDRCEHALRSLQKSMKWDEEKFGREYDLDIYMIVAVNDFNMGAMENKGLNVFNSKYVLAIPETATDDDYEGIESVIAHEYFHNWTGNRVTCRDWFQLTLKEGLTVYRDQRFSEDMTSEPVNRIASVKALRARQFSEDEGPMAHPIRPDSYISMDNFYTATVYEKGAEVIRMYASFLGEQGFRKGMDLYFERHDGQAVTCDDFRAAMADANDFDFSQFERWYSQAGMLRLRAEDEWDAGSGRYTLRFKQAYPETAFEIVGADSRKPLPMPIRIGLLGADGADLPLRLAGEPSTGEAPRTRVLEVEESESEFVFEGIGERPVPSILRGFSAPVRFEMNRDRKSLSFLMAYDSDAFNRWDAGQQLALELLVERAEPGGNPNAEIDSAFADAWGRVLMSPDLDGSLKSLALGLPAERVIGQEMSIIDPDAIHAARNSLGRQLSERHRDALWKTYRDCSTSEPYRHEQSEINRRRLRAAALRALVWNEDDEAIEAAWQQFETADNMTDAQSAFLVLADLTHARRDDVIEAFYARWSDDPLVVDKWFAVQAGSARTDTLEQVRNLALHPAFNAKNPNRVRSLVGAFCSGNQVRFHDPSGAGYVFLADWVLELNEANPQVASRMASIFNDWRRYDEGRQRLLQGQLDRIASSKTLSKDVYEIVSRALSR